MLNAVSTHGDTNHLETRSGCARVRKKAQRTMESCRKDRGSPACSQLWTDKKFYKHEEGDNEGLYYNKSLAMYKHIPYNIIIYYIHNINILYIR